MFTTKILIVSSFVVFSVTLSNNGLASCAISSPGPANVSQIVDSAVTFTCYSTNREMVRWSVRKDSSLDIPTPIYNGVKVGSAYRSRVTVLRNGETGRNDMTLVSLRRNDSGLYMCYEISSELSKVHFKLRVTDVIQQVDVGKTSFGTSTALTSTAEPTSSVSAVNTIQTEEQSTQTVEAQTTSGNDGTLTEDSKSNEHQLFYTTLCAVLIAVFAVCATAVLIVVIIVRRTMTQVHGEPTNAYRCVPEVEQVRAPPSPVPPIYARPKSDGQYYSEIAEPSPDYVNVTDTNAFYDDASAAEPTPYDVLDPAARAALRAIAAHQQSVYQDLSR